MSQNWVARFVDEEKLKDQVQRRDIAAAAHHVEVVRFHLQYLMVALKDRVTRDVEAFAREFPDRRVSFADCDVEDGFTVRRDCYPEAHLTVTTNRDGSIRVQYLFASGDGTSSPKLMELVPNGERGFAVHVRHGGGQSFAGVEQLSEFLLVPLFSGHSR
jgi:hypothetical protein